MRRIQREAPSSIPSDVAAKLGYYVYAFVNPIDGRMFYVGKGKRQRALDHFKDGVQSPKRVTLEQIRNAGRKPRIDILAHGLKTAAAALRVEAAVIDALGLPTLANRVRGWQSVRLGRRPLDEVIALYRKKPIEIREPAILIRINRLYRPSMTPTELYDATRGIWTVGDQRERARFAFAVFQDVIREVYEIKQWFPAGSTLNSRDFREFPLSDRWEFVGRLAAGHIRRRYVGRFLGSFQQGSQNPIKYVNVG